MLIDPISFNQNSKYAIDSFFIHQCIIRRFKQHNLDDYNSLLNIRYEIESTVNSTRLKEIPLSVYEVSSTELTTEVSHASMSFFENKKNLHSINNETPENTRKIFREHLSFSISKYSYMKSIITDNNIDEIINILKKNIKFYNMLITKYNIFNYYSLFSMTIYIEFDIFLKFYLELKHNEEKSAWYAQFSDKEARWLYASKSETYSNSNLYILISTGCFERKFYSPNINIISDYDDNIIINDTKSQNSIYLKLSVDQLPINIDEAIQYYKLSINRLLNRNSVYKRERIRNDGFKNSQFMKLHRKNTCLIVQRNSIGSYIIGLWCWDIVKYKEYSIEKAIERIEKDLPKNFPYTAITIKRHYNKIASILSPKTGKKSNKALDKFVTGSDSIIIGLSDK